MFSAAAAESIYWLFEQALQDNAIAEPGQACRVALQPAPSTATSAGHLVVLNISSYSFRIVALFDFPASPDLRSHLAKKVRSHSTALEGQAWLDALSEMVNMTCGAVNRGLCTAFRHAAMSTPFVLERHCGQFIEEIGPAVTACFAVTVNEDVRFDLTLCLCAKEVVDFRVDRSGGAVEEAGELELF